MNQYALMALLVPIVGVPLFTYWMTTRQAGKSRDRQNVQAGEEKREREVVSMMLISSNKEIAAVAKRTAEETKTTLSAIHALVNSNLTQAQERELASARSNLASMRQVIELKQDRGVPVLPETLTAITHLEAQIGALAEELRVKHEAMDTNIEPPAVEP